MRSSARPASAWMSARWTGGVAYRYTDRVMPPCHHWSWSSMNDASDHLTTRQGQLVVASAEERRELELRREVGVLADAHGLPVALDHEDALGGTHMEHDPPALPVAGHPERATVDARGVRVRDMRGPVREGHPDVGVVGHVPGVLHRPGARDRDVAPRLIQGRLGVRQELEAPGAIEVQTVGVGDRVHAHTAAAGQLRVIPGSGHGTSVGVSRPAGRVRAARSASDARPASASRRGEPLVRSTQDHLLRADAHRARDDLVHRAAEPGQPGPCAGAIAARAVCAGCHVLTHQEHAVAEQGPVIGDACQVAGPATAATRPDGHIPLAQRDEPRTRPDATAEHLLEPGLGLGQACPAAGALDGRPVGARLDLAAHLPGAVTERARHRAGLGRLAGTRGRVCLGHRVGVGRGVLGIERRHRDEPVTEALADRGSTRRDRIVGMRGRPLGRAGREAIEEAQHVGRLGDLAHPHVHGWEHGDRGPAEPSRGTEQLGDAAVRALAQPVLLAVADRADRAHEPVRLEERDRVGARTEPTRRGCREVDRVAGGRARAIPAHEADERERGDGDDGHSHERDQRGSLPPGCRCLGDDGP